MDITKYLTNDGNTISIPKTDIDQMDKEAIIQAVSGSTISYPLLKYFLEKPYTLFRYVTTYEPIISKKYENILSNWKDQRLKKTTYRGLPLNFIQRDEDYDNLDRITDLFTEYARIQAKRYDKPETPEQFFIAHKEDLVRECLTQTGMIDSFAIREIIWKKKYEATNFKVSLATGIYIYFNAKRILDISAGWGDRLIAAIGHQAERYLAFDPNERLRAGHSKIQETFQADPKRYTVRYQPFETADIGNEKFDLIFTSPPYFDLEVYDTNVSTATNQSISQYNGFEQWLISFLFRSLLNAWKHLEVGGNMVIHISDFDSGRKTIVEPMVMFVLSRCSGAKFDGVIGTRGASGKMLPMWAFYKDKSDDKRMMDENELSMRNNYPTIYAEYVKVYGQNIAAAPVIDKTEIQQIISQGFPFVNTFWSVQNAQDAYGLIKTQIVDKPIVELKRKNFIETKPYDILRDNREGPQVLEFIRRNIRSNDKMKFNGEFISVLSQDRNLLDEDYNLVDYFTEPSKIVVRLGPDKPSLADHFKDGTLVANAMRILKQKSRPINGRTIHDMVVSQSDGMKTSVIGGKDQSVYLSSAENVFVYIILFKLLFPKMTMEQLATLNILDGAGGYGSRLMASIMLDANYIGVEPNPLSTPGFTEMIKMFGTPSKQKMIEDGLPIAREFLEIPDGWAHIVMFSPPMWGKEVYNDADEKQSIHMFNNEQLWLEKFLYASLEELWKRLRVGGYIVFQSVRYDYIGEHMIKHHANDAEFKGIIARVTSNGRRKPNWVWQKM
jgi:hypothetical protein